jgi:hypothetical protein
MLMPTAVTTRRLHTKEIFRRFTNLKTFQYKYKFVVFLLSSSLNPPSPYFQTVYIPDHAYRLPDQPDVASKMRFSLELRAFHSPVVDAAS